jgi:hypothetical protein
MSSFVSFETSLSLCGTPWGLTTPPALWWLKGILTGKPIGRQYFFHAGWGIWGESVPVLAKHRKSDPYGVA